MHVRDKRNTWRKYGDCTCDKRDRAQSSGRRWGGVAVEVVARMLTGSTPDYKLRPLIPDDVNQLKILHSQVFLAFCVLLHFDTRAIMDLNFITLIFETIASS